MNILTFGCNERTHSKALNKNKGISLAVLNGNYKQQVVHRELVVWQVGDGDWWKPQLASSFSQNMPSMVALSSLAPTP